MSHQGSFQTSYKTICIVLGCIATLLAAGCASDNTTPDKDPELVCGRLTVINAAGTACQPFSAISSVRRDVAFDSSDSPGGKVKLRGRITLPKWGAGPQPAKKLPGVLLIGGSGPHSYRGVTPGELTGPYPRPIPVLDNLASGLSMRGYAVMSFNKRTCVPQVDPDCTASLEEAQNATWSDLVGDVAAAAKVLAAQPEVDPEDIILVGHSQGANLALEAAGKLPDVTELVLLGATFRSIDIVLVDQVQWQTKAFDGALTNAQRDAAQKELATIRSTLEAIRSKQYPEDDLFLGAKPQFWRDYIDSTRMTNIHVKRLKLPTLYLRGKDDQNASIKEERGFLTVAQKRNDFVIKSLEGHNHALARSKTGTRVSKQTIDTITEWLSRDRTPKPTLGNSKARRRR